MNKKPFKPCRHYGCPNLTRETYCEKHKHKEKEKESIRQKHYDMNVRYKRDKKYADFYRSKEWENLRNYILSVYNGIDVYAYYVDKEIVIANTVHHIEELKENWSKRFDIYNLFPISEGNHSRIHKLYLKDKKGTQKLLRELLERYRKEFGINL